MGGSVKILIAHNGTASCNAAIGDMRRAGLPEQAKAVVLRGNGTSSAEGEAAGARIQQEFPKWDVASEMLSGAPTEAILNMSKWWRPDLLIIGSDTFERERSMTNNVALDVAHQARCSVRLARNGKTIADPIRLIIGDAGHKECGAVMREVASRRWPKDTEAHVISIVRSDHDEMQKTVTADSIGELRNAGLKVFRKVITGDPHQELVREAERCHADAIFIAPHCLPEMQRFLLGSVATAVVTRARSTVELVRQAS
jgi:nucleotide-binding universal stress UspA family protein